MNKRLSIILAVVAIVFVAGYFLLLGNVSYEIIASLPADSHIEDIQRDKDLPVTVAVNETYIAVLPPYGYEVEFLDVVRDGGIAMLYNLKELDDPNGEAPVFAVKVSNPMQGPIGAVCKNLDILN